MMKNNKTNKDKALYLDIVKRSFWCKIGIHKLKYIEKYNHTAKVKCSRKGCNAEFIEGMPGELYRC